MSHEGRWTQIAACVGSTVWMSGFIPIVNVLFLKSWTFDWCVVNVFFLTLDFESAGCPVLLITIWGYATLAGLFLKCDEVVVKFEKMLGVDFVRHSLEA